MTVSNNIVWHATSKCILAYLHVYTSVVRSVITMLLLTYYILLHLLTAII